MAEIKTILESQGDAFKAFQEKQGARLDDLEAYIKKSNRPGVGDAGEGKRVLPQYFDAKSNRPITVFGRDDQLTAHEAKTGSDLPNPSIGRVLRGIVLGGKAHDAKALEEERKALSIGSDPSGGYTVSGALSSQWIDLLRSQLALNAAGVTTVPMETSELTIAKLTGDPAVFWHAENASIPESEATFGAITLKARTAVCLVKLSLELSQDSVNIESILQSSITAAMAQTLDQAGLMGVGPHSGIFDLAGRNTVTSVGAPTNWDWAVDAMYELAADNTPMDSIGAMVGHPKLWQKMRKLKTGITNDNTPLTMPEEVARMRKLWTTGAPLTGGNTAKAVMGRWSDYLFGVRKDITLQVLSQAFMGSNLQLALLAYVRADFAATRPQSFCTIEGITV